MSRISVSVLQWLALGSPLSVMPIQIARHYFIQYILFTNDYIVQNKSLGSVHISWNSKLKSHESLALCPHVSHGNVPLSL